MIHTERTYCDWIKRYIRHHRMTGRQDLIDGEAKIEAFLTHLAVDKAVSSSIQNQAMNALVFLRPLHNCFHILHCRLTICVLCKGLFLYKHVLKRPLDGKINVVRAIKKVNVPIVMTHEEVAHIIALMEGTPNWLSSCFTEVSCVS
ncbi:MAG: phage integrase N-terminal SAM-like domain-containing protein [Deltaproteobacteria bacterium]|nr:phage integrase N-terminal SAM-like domain-containing protein [Deltaproteobacteria bacterium]